MFSYNECLDSLKYLAKNSRIDDKTYCQRLDIISKKIGFNDFYHFRSSFTKIPSDTIGRISTRLMRLYCESALPQLGKAYFEFYSVRTPKHVHIQFYSSWAGYDSLGREVRVPRELDGTASISGVRTNSEVPVYVIENMKQLAAWHHIWFGSAFIRKDLAKVAFKSKFDRQHRICENVDVSLIRAAGEDYNDNIAI